MRNTVNDQGKYLTTQEYKELINDLIEDKDRQECYDIYCQTYLPSNPNFEFKFFEVVKELGYPERLEYYTTNDIDKEERETIEKFWLSDDKNHYSQLDQAYRKLTLWALDNNKSMKYTELCWSLFKYSDTQREIEDNHNSKFSGLEMIYILKLLSEAGWHNSISKNKSLAIVLSELIGLKASTLEKYIQKYKEHWDPTKTITDGIKKDRQLSLTKINRFLEAAGTSTLTTKMINNMKPEKDRFHFFDEMT